MVDVDKCCLTKFPTPVLSGPAEPVSQIDDNIRQLAEKMIDLMVEARGVGLAGPQAGVGLRIFVVSPDGTRENAKVYINPTIETAGKIESNEEGCLSLPGVFAKIKRYSQCTVTALDLEGNEFTETGEGLMARAFQHEYDHLEGTMIKDRMNRMQKIGSRKRLKQLLEEYNQDE